MFKQALTKSTKELHLTLDLLVRIRRKLHSLGYSPKEIRKMILEVVRKVLNIPVESTIAFQRIIVNKLKQKHKDQIKLAQQLIIQLDIFLNSFYDNYESQEDGSKVKLEPLSVQSFEKKMQSSKSIMSRQALKNDISSPKYPKRSIYSKEFHMNLNQENQSDNLYKKAVNRRKLLQNDQRL